MNGKKTVCVFCAASDRVPDCYKDEAYALGGALAKAHVGTVNGAGFVGLMGRLSDAALAAGGEVTGVIPQFMVDEGWCHKGLTHLVVTPDMATRKQQMRDLSDGIIALAGGCGTMEELLEAITARQLHLYDKPIIIVNTNGFFDFFTDWWQRCMDEHFMHHEHEHLVSFANSAEEAVAMFLNEVKQSKA